MADFEAMRRAREDPLRLAIEREAARKRNNRYPDTDARRVYMREYMRQRRPEIARETSTMSERYTFPAVNIAPLINDLLRRHVDPEFARLELKWIRANELPNLTATANYLGVSRQTVYTWRTLPQAKRLSLMAEQSGRRPR